LAIWEQALRPDHPTTAIALNNLALLYDAQGAYAKAEPLLRRGIESQSTFLQGQLPFLPIRQRQAQIQALDAAWEVAFSGAERSATAAELALFSRLNRYGLLLEIERRQALLSRTHGPHQQLATEITALTNRLADVNLPQPQRQALQERRAEKERQLYRLLPELKPRLVEPTELASHLPAGAVLVEFQRYRPFDGRQAPEKRWGAARYVALVLSPASGEKAITQAVDLGPAAPIDQAIAKALQESQAPGGLPDPLWRQVNAKVFPAALRALLHNHPSWILAPDGEISRIPFFAIPSPLEQQQRLVEQVELRLVSSGRALLPRQASATAMATPIVVADPAFGPLAADGDGWRRLPFAGEEGRAISKQTGGVLYERERATTAVLSDAKQPKLLHIASHGYYAAASEATRKPRARPMDTNRSAFAGLPANREDAMLNSAIVLAGANRHRRPDPFAATSNGELDTGTTDDGHLTAKETAQLQLDGTELVVLSACDTASGEQRSGEGLYGLQRAISVAGARSTLLSPSGRWMMRPPPISCSATTPCSKQARDEGKRCLKCNGSSGKHPNARYGGIPNTGRPGSSLVRQARLKGWTASGHSDQVGSHQSARL
jgi:hypothetical protein